MDRRRLLALGGVGALVAGGTGAKGAEINYATPGVTIQIRHYHGVWEVVVPDWEYAENTSQINGFMLPVKWMPLAEFLAALEA